MKNKLFSLFLSISFIMCSFAYLEAKSKHRKSSNAKMDGKSIVGQEKKAPKGILFILTAPSGTGKTTVMNALMERNPNIKKVISSTTRKPRHTEENGVDYNFMTKEAFMQASKQGKFVEKATSYSNYYGVLRSDIEGLINNSHDMIIDLNYYGVQQMKENLKDSDLEIITVFLLPPSIAELERRLSGRKTDTKEIIDARMNEVESQLESYSDYDYIIHYQDSVLDVVQKLEIIYKDRLLKRSSVDNSTKIYEDLKQELKLRK